MKKILIGILGLTLLTQLSCIKQKGVTEDEIYTIINQIISDDSIRFGNLNNKFSDIRFSEACIKEIEKKDLSFILDQKKKNKGIFIKDKYLKEFWPRDKQYHLIRLDSTSNNCISIPLISADRNKILIEILTAGQGATYIYVRINNKWLRKSSFDSWII